MDHVITSMDQLFILMLDSFWAVIGSVLLYTTIGLVIAIALIVLIKRKKLAQRENFVWNFMTNFHYLFVLSAFLLTSPILGGTRAVHHMMNGIISGYLSPSIEEQVSQIQQAIVSAWPERRDTLRVSSKDTVNRLIKKLHYTPNSDTFFSQKKADLINWLLINLGSEIVGSTVTVMASIAIGETLEPLEGGREAFVFPIQHIKKTDYSQLGEGVAQAVDTYVSSYIDIFFKGFYINTFYVLLLFIAIPTLEMLFFNLWWKKRTLPVATHLPDSGALEKQ